MEAFSESAKHIRELVKRYCEQEIHPRTSAFRIDGPYETKDVKSSDIANFPGCYVIYGEDKKIRYIGESHCLANRSLSHFAPRIQRSRFWSDGSRARYIDLIQVQYPWQRFSLEQYLYDKLGGAKGIRGSWHDGYLPSTSSIRMNDQ